MKNFFFITVLFWCLSFTAIFATWMLVVWGYCFFISGCYEHLTFNQVWNTVDSRMIAIRVSLLTILIVGIVWLKRREQSAVASDRDKLD